MPDPQNVTQLQPTSPASQSAGGGNGRNLHGRVSSIEAHLQHLATKEDIAEVKKLISDRESAMLRWLIGIISLATISLAVALVRMFIS